MIIINKKIKEHIKNIFPYEIKNDKNDSVLLCTFEDLLHLKLELNNFIEKEIENIKK